MRQCQRIPLEDIEIHLGAKDILKRLLLPQGRILLGIVHLVLLHAPEGSFASGRMRKTIAYNRQREV
jgi:hypothetical protein